MTGRHRRRRGIRRWAGLAIMALFVFVASLVVAPLVARADVLPPALGGCDNADPTAGFDLANQTNPVTQIGPIINVRAGKHRCFDRVVVDVHGPAPGWSARYVDQFVVDPSGLVRTVPGSAVLELVIRANGHDIRTGRSTLHRMPAVGSFTTLRAVVLGGDFEGQTQFGIGVDPKTPFRVFALRGTGGVSHVVVDLAHA